MDTQQVSRVRWTRRLFGRIKPTAALLLQWVLAAVTICAAMTVVVLDLRSTALERNARETQVLAQVLGEQTARAVQGVDLILRAAQDSLAKFRAAGIRVDDPRVYSLLRAQIAGVPYVRALFVVGPNGVSIDSSSSLHSPHLFAADRDYFKEQSGHRNGGLFIGHPVRSRYNQTWTIHMSRRLAGAHGRSGGVIVASVNVSYFEALYRSIKVDPGSRIALFLRDGTVLASEPRRALRSLTVRPSAYSDADPENAKRYPMGAATDRSPLIITYRAIADLPLVTGVAISERDALAAWRYQATLTVAAAILVIVVLALAAAALARKVAREHALSDALEESEIRLKEIVRSAHDAIITADAQQRVVLFNPAAEKMFGVPAERALGERLDRFMPDLSAREPNSAGDGERPDGRESSLAAEAHDIVGRRADGTKFPLDASLSPATVKGKALHTAILRDMTQRRQFEEDLKRSNKQLRELSASLQSVREEERARIARELHDELGQQLTSLKMDLSWLETKIPVAPPKVADKIRRMNKLIDLTLTSLRRIASELRPLILDDLGLEAAVRWLADEFGNRTGIAVEFAFAADGPHPDNAVATAVFRILQESLTNVARHAGASHVQIAIMCAQAQLTLCVVDNGKGIAARAESTRRSFGLLGMRERAQMLGGTVRIDSRAGDGTTIEVTLPLKTQAREESIQ